MAALLLGCATREKQQLEPVTMGQEPMTTY